MVKLTFIVLGLFCGTTLSAPGAKVKELTKHPASDYYLDLSNEYEISASQEEDYYDEASSGDSYDRSNEHDITPLPEVDENGCPWYYPWCHEANSNVQIITTQEVIYFFMPVLHTIIINQTYIKPVINISYTTEKTVYQLVFPSLQEHQDHDESNEYSTSIVYSNEHDSTPLPDLDENGCPWYYPWCHEHNAVLQINTTQQVIRYFMPSLHNIIVEQTYVKPSVITTYAPKKTILQLEWSRPEEQQVTA